MTELPVSADAHSSQYKSCPFCAEEIRLNALKCKHCGESVNPKPFLQRLSTRFIALVGLVTTAMSLFYALREGYFYIEQKQQQRAELDSYRSVADHFEKLDLLNYAQHAVKQALDIAPNNIVLQRQYFMLQSNDLLREIEWNGPAGERHPQIEQLILNGYRLLEAESDSKQKAQLLVMLGRLLPQDMLWNDDDGVTQLFARAYALQPQDAEVVFRYGSWLVDMELDKSKGLAMIRQALLLKPDDALYPYELAKILRADGKFSEALPLLQTAIKLLPKQRELQRIRASNFSKTELRKLFVQASKVQDINHQFLDLDLLQRRQLLEQLLELRENDREINFVAAQFYLAQQQYELAEQAIKHTIAEDDLRAQLPRGYYLEQFELYRDILKQSGSDPLKLAQIEEGLQHYQDAQHYEEVLDMGIKGEHNYKIGLKLVKQENQDTAGLEVLEAYSAYPFARAGLLKGDVLLKLAHRELLNVKTIYRILSGFEPGTILPLQINRDGQKMELSLQVE
jgi:tetratricopeptide (TPR) repeat protein